MKHVPRALLDDLDRPLAAPHVEPFPDVRAVLEELRSRGIRMAIVTDNWGDADSVRRKHDRISLEGFFEACCCDSRWSVVSGAEEMVPTGGELTLFEAVDPWV